MKQIIGNGDISQALQEVDKDLLFFCSGVSNSKETRESEYKREEDLLMKQDHFKHIVYFSSLSIFYKNGRYQKHKMKMEHLIKSFFEHWTIIRLGNITFGKNPNTLINYLKAHPEAEIKDEYRYICDKEELLHWINLIPSWNCEINVPGRRMLVKDVAKEYCG